MAAPLHLGGVVINLTGAAQQPTLTMEFPGLSACGWSFGVLQRTLRDESAAATLADIVVGRTTRWLLPWIPLMYGGGRAAIIRGWQRAARSEPTVEARATLAGLTFVFAGLASRSDESKTLRQEPVANYNGLKSLARGFGNRGETVGEN